MSEDEEDRDLDEEEADPYGERQEDGQGDDLHRGVVKSYFAKKGFGFITSDQVEGDVFFMRTQVPPELVDAISEEDKFFTLAGCFVVFKLHVNEKGKKQVRELSFPAEEGQTFLGVVKSYNAQKGYGFIKSSALEKDVFFLRSAMPEVFRSKEGSLAGMEARFVLFVEDGKTKGTNLALRPPPGMYPPPPPPVMDMPPGYGFPPRAPYGAPPRPSGPYGIPGYGLPPMPPALAAQNYGRHGDAAPARRREAARNPYVSEMSSYGRLPPPMMHPFALDPYGRDPPGNWLPPPAEGETVHGTVKSFDARSGYGFINAPGISQQVYFKAKGMGHDLQDVQAGDKVSFVLVFTKDGKPQAKNVSVGGADAGAYVDEQPSGNAAPGKRRQDRQPKEPPAPPSRARPRPAASEVPAAKRRRSDGNAGGGGGNAYLSDRLSGRVKSFRADKGFGFIVSPDVSGDVYFKRSALPVQKVPTNFANLPVTFELKHTPEGKPQAEEIAFGEE